MGAWETRADWGARASEGAKSLVASQVVGTAIHWPGMSVKIDATGPTGYRRVASALRGWQKYHMDVRGWSDIAYQAAVDQAGRKWILRGLNVRSGANGDATVNSKYGAILLILGPGEKPTLAMETTVREVVGEFRRRFPKGVKIVRHGDIRAGGTDCPGPAASAALHAGRFAPIAIRPPAGGVVTTTVYISLKACQYSALHPGEYLPGGTDDVVNVKQRLVNLRIALATDGFRTAYAKWQRHLGYTGSDADGIPGATSLGVLCKNSGWVMVA